MDGKGNKNGPVHLARQSLIILQNVFGAEDQMAFNKPRVLAQATVWVRLLTPVDL